jgi:poly(A) polymerase
VPTDPPLKQTENGLVAPANRAPVSEAPPPAPPALKEHTDLKTPQLPFGENVGVVTGVVAAQ